MMKQKFTDLPIEKQDQSKTVTFFVNATKGTVTCRLYDRWYNTFHTGTTRCHDTDKFDEKKGRTIAFNKARKKELEFNLKMIEREAAKLNKFYHAATEDLEKRTHINVVYLTGVNEELKGLMK